VGAATPRYSWATATTATHGGGHALAGLAPAALRHQAVQDPDQQHGQGRQLLGGQRPGVPVDPERHPERPRPLDQRGQQILHDEAQHHPGAQHHQQLPQAPQHQQGRQQPPQQDGDGGPGAEGGQGLHRPGQAGAAQPGQPADHRGVHGGDGQAGAAPAVDEDHHRRHGQDHGRDQPAEPAGLEVVGQRWRLAGGAPSRRAWEPGRAERASRGRRLVCGHVHVCPLAEPIPHQRMVVGLTARRPPGAPPPSPAGAGGAGRGPGGSWPGGRGAAAGSWATGSRPAAPSR